MKKLFLILIFVSAIFADEEFNQKFEQYRNYYNGKNPNFIANYIFKREQNEHLFNRLDMKGTYSYNYGTKGNVFYLKLKVKENEIKRINEFKNAVEKLICQEPILSAAILTKMRLEFSVWNPYIDFYHYKFGYSQNSQPNCIYYRSLIKSNYNFF